MIRRQFKKHRGFTLIEIVMVIVILGIVTSVTAPMMYSAVSAVKKQHEISKVGGQARVALDRMVRELRMIRSNDVSDLTIGASSITFLNVNGVTTTYSLSGVTLMRNSQALADDVTSLSFTYQNANGVNTLVNDDVRYITINMTIIENDTSMTLGDTVFVRNLM